MGGHAERRALPRAPTPTPPAAAADAADASATAERLVEWEATLRPVGGLRRVLQLAWLLGARLAQVRARHAAGCLSALRPRDISHVFDHTQLEGGHGGEELSRRPRRAGEGAARRRGAPRRARRREVSADGGARASRAGRRVSACGERDRVEIESYFRVDTKVKSNITSA